MDERITEITVKTPGLRFHCATLGDGPLLLLLHGFPERWFSWRPLMPALAARGFRVVAPDLPGYGGTERPADGYDPRELSRHLVALLPALGAERATIIGHDWGGLLTWELVSRYPEQVTRFGVLNAPHPVVLYETFLGSWAQRRRSWYALAFALPWLPERALTARRGALVARMFRAGATDPTQMTDEVLAPYRESVLPAGTVGAMLAYYRTAVRTALAPGGAARFRSYRTIERPGLLVWAEDEFAFVPEIVPAHLAWARDLRVRRLPGCGHFLLQEQPGAVGTILADWLGEAEG